MRVQNVTGRGARVVDSFAGGGASNGIELALENLKELGLLPEGHSLDPDFAVTAKELARRSPVESVELSRTVPMDAGWLP